MPVNISFTCEIKDVFLNTHIGKQGIHKVYEIIIIKYIPFPFKILVGIVCIQYGGDTN